MTPQNEAEPNYTLIGDLFDLLPDISDDTIVSRSIFQDGQLRAILFGFAPGQELSEHTAARPAILTAFLGYGAVAVGLLFDLGLPWHIWHMTIFWNPRSPLFEVGWCVMLYLTVLALEVAPVILVKTKYTRIFRFPHDSG